MLREIHVSEGDGQPYIVAPEEFKLSLFESIKDKVSCTYPRSGGVNAVLQLVDTLPKDVEKPIDEWLAQLSADVQKSSYGMKENPSCIIWHFDPHADQEAKPTEVLRAS